MARKPGSIVQSDRQSNKPVGLTAGAIFEPLEGRQLMSAAPGTLDPAFGAGGVVKTNAIISDFLPSDIPDIAVDAAGRSVVVGQRHGDFAVLRLKPDGSADASFGGG